MKATPPGRCARLLALALPLAAAPAAAEGPQRVVPEVLQQALVALPPPPPWDLPPGGPLFAFGDIAREVSAQSASRPQMVHQADAFVRPDLPWLRAYVKWFSRLKKPLHMQAADQTFDCDKFSRCFVSFADLLVRKAGESRASVAVGWVAVTNDHAFGGVAAGGSHALVLVETTSGLFIVEPQTGEMTPFARYPNRDLVQQVNF